MQPNPTNISSWEGFKDRKPADNLEQQLAASIKQVRARKRKPAAAPAESDVAGLLRQAIRAVAARKSPARDTAARETVLLEVLCEMLVVRR